MIDNLGQQNSTPYNIQQQKLHLKQLALKYLSNTDANNTSSTSLITSSSKGSNQRDSAEFSAEGLSQLASKNVSNNKDNTSLLDFSSGVVGFDYTTQMYTLEDGTTFPASTIHKVDKNSCTTLAAENNNLIFHSNTYYNYSEVNGDTWLMAVNEDYIYQAPSDRDLNDYPVEQRLAIVNAFNFFSSLVIDKYPVGLDTFYSDDEILAVMKNVGITPGKFTIGIDDKVRTYYLTKDGTILSDEQVSKYRDGFNQKNVFELGYTKDDIWLVDGVEIRPDEQGYLHIPDNLGADIKVIRHSNKETD
jgi:hypothetical protein